MITTELHKHNVLWTKKEKFGVPYAEKSAKLIMSLQLSQRISNGCYFGCHATQETGLSVEDMVERAFEHSERVHKVRKVSSKHEHSAEESGQRVLTGGLQAAAVRNTVVPLSTDLSRRHSFLSLRDVV